MSLDFIILFNLIKKISLEKKEKKENNTKKGKRKKFKKHANKYLA